MYTVHLIHLEANKSSSKQFLTEVLTEAKTFFEELLIRTTNINNPLRINLEFTFFFYNVHKHFLGFKTFKPLIPSE